MKTIIEFINEKQNFLIKGHTKKQVKDMRNIYYYERNTMPYTKLYVMELKTNKELLTLAEKSDLSDEIKLKLKEMYDMWPEGAELVLYCGFSKKSGKITLDCIGDKAITKNNVKPIGELDFNDFSPETWKKNNWIL